MPVAWVPLEEAVAAVLRRSTCTTDVTAVGILSAYAARSRLRFATLPRASQPEG